MADAADGRDVAVITGATSGIGFATACGLARAGFRLILTGRNSERIAPKEKELSELGAKVDWITVDFASQQETRQAAGDIAALANRIDVLVNNAGRLLDDRYVTVDGLEKTFAVNHLAPFILTNLLMPQLQGSDHAHVITVSSIGHSMISDMCWDDLQMENDFSHHMAYFQSKLANVLFTRELARRYPSERFVASAVHPGMVASKFPDSADEYTQKAYAEAAATGQAISNEEGAETILWLATHRDQALPSGGYFYNKKRVATTINGGTNVLPSGAPLSHAVLSAAAQSDEGAARLWEVSKQLTGVG